MIFEQGMDGCMNMMGRILMDDFKKIENGTGADIISWHFSTARVTVSPNTSTSNEGWLPMEFYPIPDVVIPENEGLDPIALLNRAYEALPPEERDEMELWDCTIKDGLDEE